MVVIPPRKQVGDVGCWVYILVIYLLATFALSHLSVRRYITYLYRIVIDVYLSLLSIEPQPLLPLEAFKTY